MGIEPDLTTGMGSYWRLDEVLAELRVVRENWRAAHPRNREHGSATFPSRRTLEEVMSILCGVLFPLRLGPSYVRADNEAAYVAETLENGLSHLYGQLRRELAYSSVGGAEEATDAEARRIIGAFAHDLPSIRTLLDTDVEAAFANDPAARSVDEMLLCYPSLLAIIHYRVASRLHRLGAPLVARIIGEIAHSDTGIDIHPGATIGHSIFIDHGTGLVIGETAVIGDRVRLHQSVTLGGPAGPLEEGRGRPRHPVIEDDVIIYAGATLLGRIVIGARSIVGGNVWLTETVPPDSRVEQARPTF
ncbi:serine O-acetyltransferase EpsC [Sphingomonas sp. BIUV-7]|uniref:serine O-acetyltransferase n=1 Tax=Sphingomonas natans TaxID=3063330 RepID=A0ABT8YCN4_9SPHN|nr:serine O-acetyltransferase EpsC [Sphingomonas sp. BIUV-7]MDO6415588.1 serine O-acetyltransferase EpsC [Sphingomonas sp. BIUV-7]